MNAIFFFCRGVLCRILLVSISCILVVSAQAQEQTVKHGILVKAKTEQDAIEQALKQFIDQLNLVLGGDEVARDRMEREFGKWLSRNASLSAGSGSSNERQLKYLLFRGNQVPKIHYPTMGSRKVGGEGDANPQYVAILGVENSSFRLCTLFFGVDAISKRAGDVYDIAFIPGLFFVGGVKGTE